MKKVFTYISSALLAVAVLVPAYAVAALPQNVTATKTLAEQGPAVDISQSDVPAYMKTNADYGIMSLQDMPKLGFLSPSLTYTTGLNIPNVTSPASVPDIPLIDGAPSTTFINAFVGYSSGMSAFGTTTTNFMMQYLPTTAASVKRLSSGLVYANGGGFYADGVYYTTYFTTNATTGAVTYVYNRTYNASTWAQTKSTSVLSTKGLSTRALCCSYDVVSGLAYGHFYNKEGTAIVFSSIDKNFNVTEISTVNSGAQWLTCAFDGKGNLFATTANGNLYKVNLKDGSTTTIGNTGLATKYNTSGAIDPRTGTYYVVIIKADASDNPIGTGVYSIDTTTAKATHIYDFDGIAQLYGMYVADPIAEDAAPAAVSDITFNYQEGSLDGAIEFMAPSTTYDGEPAKGTMNYFVVSGTDTIGKGSTEYGVKVSVPYKFAAAGKQTVSVTPYNEAGNGPSLSATSDWLGPDTPKNPTGLTLKEIDGKIVLSWDSVVGTKNTGYIDVNKVTYNVTLTAPTPVTTLSEGQSATTYEYAPADPTEFKTYSFRVNAVYEGLVSSNTTGSITIGRITPPYNADYRTGTTALNGYTIIDANEDGSTWKYYSSSYGVGLIYQNKRPSDDYLITPALYLEGGKNYTIDFEACGWADRYIEQFEVLFGDAPTIEGLTVNLSDTVTIQTAAGAFVPFNYVLKPEKTGVYYLAFHGISPNIDESGYLISNLLAIKNLNISGAIDKLAPAAPRIEAIPGAYGEISATVNIVAPHSNINGYTLGSIKEVVLYREGAEIKRFSDVRPGQKLTYVDSAVKAGINSYSAEAINNYGTGYGASSQVFVGYTNPSPVENLVVVETNKDGEVKLTWNNVTADLNGLEYREGDVTYTIKNKSGVAVATGLTENTYTYQALEEGNADFVLYNITAVTAKGSSAAVSSNMLPVGPAYKLPFSESYPGGQLYSPLGYEVSQTNMATLSLGTDTSLSSVGVTSYDGDNGYLYYRFYATGILANLFTAKIDLTEAKNPAFSVQTFAFLSSNTGKATINALHLMAREVGTEEWADLAFYDKEAFNTVGWNRLIGSLEQFKGKVVQVGIIVQCTGMTYSVFDDMTVYDAPDFDLEAVDITAPAVFVPNKTEDVVVTVNNLGGVSARGYNVELFVNGKSYATVSGEKIAPLSSTKVVVPVTLNPIVSDKVEMYAVVNYAADSDKSNNTTSRITSALQIPTFPTVNDLVAAKNKDVAANLSWSAPANPVISSAITDSFESYESFAVDKAGDWTFYDGDKRGVYSINGRTIPNLPYVGSYMILDADYSGFEGNTTFLGHSDYKTLACFAAEGAPNDDWAISPELNGRAQTVKFFARTYTDQYGSEAFEFYYSMTGNSTKDFIKLGEDKNVPTDWTEYSYNLPEGAKYFAIRCVSDDQFIFMVDDVTYEPAGTESIKLSIEGYNVYRNGEKVNDALITATSYVDTPEEEGLYYYQVTVVYKEYGESAGSNEVDVEISKNGGVEAVEVANVAISSGNGVIVVRGAEGETAQVVTIDGKLINNVLLTGETYVSVAPGVYVVKVNSTVAKVVVK